MNAFVERLTFGASSSELAEVARVGVDGWLKQQLSPLKDDPSLEEALQKAVLRISYPASAATPPEYPAVNENRALSCLSQSTQELWPLTDGQRKMAYEERIRPLREAMASKLLHARYSRWQVRELMLDFWQNHFNVHAGDAAIAVAMPEFDRGLRRLALGNFAELLGWVSKSTPMLIYLNNRSSKTGAPNENFARELFELHTLGRRHYLNDLYSRWREVPGALNGRPSGYIDQDVYEAARAFTGWMIEDGRGLGSGVNLPSTGQFAYVDAWHDPYQKRVLAQEFEPFQGAMADGQRVLELVATHPGTARHLCEKLCRRWVDDQPPESLIESSAQVWMAHQKSPDQIARVLEHILTDASVQRGIESGQHAKLKRPLELAIGFLRKLDLELAPSQGLVNQLASAGQRLYLWPTPDGHPDVSGHWLTSHAMRQRWQLPVGLLENWWGTGMVSLHTWVQRVGKPFTQERLLDTLARDLLGEAGPATLKTILQVQAPLNPGLLSASNDEWSTLRRTIAYLAMSPAFQWK